MSQIKGVLHAGISVYHMEESLRWYEENLGFRLVEDAGFQPHLDARICFMELENGFQMELFEYKQPKPIPPERLHPNLDLQTVGMKHVAFEVEDMEGLMARFRANGVEIAHETQMGATVFSLSGTATGCFLS